MPLPKEFFLQQYQQTTGAAYIDPNHRDSVLVWKDSNPQSSNADKVVLFNTNSANAPIYLNSAISGLPSLYFDNNNILTSNNLVTMPLSAGSLNYSMFVVFNYDKTSIDTSAISCNISGIFSFGNSGETLIKVDRLDNRNIAIDFSRTNNFAQSWFQFDKTLTNETNYAFGFSADLNDTYPNLSCPSGVSCNKVKSYLNSTSALIRKATGTSTGSPSAITPSLIGIGGDVANTTVTTNLYGVSTSLPTGRPADYNSGCGGFRGLISELLVFDRTLTNEESSSVMTYLIKKYNIKSL